MRGALHKAITWIGGVAAAVAVAATLTGCDLPPICGQFGGKSVEDCVELNHAPTVRLSAAHAAVDLLPLPKVGDTLIFTAAVHDQDNDALQVLWDLNGDGRFETGDQQVS